MPSAEAERLNGSGAEPRFDSVEEGLVLLVAPTAKNGATMLSRSCARHVLRLLAHSSYEWSSLDAKIGSPMRLVKQESEEKNMAIEIKNNDEAQIRQLVANWTKALRAKDVAGLMANYTPDARLFDLAPRLQYKGADACRKSWEEWLPTFRPAGLRAARVGNCCRK
jgi:SnoaL-like domain